MLRTVNRCIMLFTSAQLLMVFTSAADFVLQWFLVWMACSTALETEDLDSLSGSRYERSSLDYLTAIIRLYSEAR